MFQIEQSGTTLNVDTEQQADRVATAWSDVDPWHTVTVTDEAGHSHLV